jgi:hypothetical protein
LTEILESLTPVRLYDTHISTIIIHTFTHSHIHTFTHSHIHRHTDTDTVTDEANERQPHTKLEDGKPWSHGSCPEDFDSKRTHSIAREHILALALREPRSGWWVGIHLSQYGSLRRTLYRIISSNELSIIKRLRHKGCVWRASRAHTLGRSAVDSSVSL